MRAQLIHGLADAWCGITGDAKESVPIFIEEVPGANVMEDGVILPEYAAAQPPAHVAMEVQ